MNSRIDKTAYKMISESGKVAPDTIERVWKESEISDQSFSQLLLKAGVLKESQILAIFSKNTGTPCVDLKTLPIDQALFSKVPVKFAWYYKFCPFKLQDGKLSIAVSKLLDVTIIDEIRFGLGFEVEIAFATEKDIEEMLKRHYGLAAETLDKILTQTPHADSPVPQSPVSVHEVEDIEKLAVTASVAQLVNQIILEAYRKRASDIHFEPSRGKIRLRYRIDGVLHEAPVPSEMKKFFVPILSRIKIMANLNIVERRLPQDGKMRVKTQDQTLDLRVSCIPTPHGESVVVRILPSQNILDINQLGFDPANLSTFEELLKRPNGIIFVTGPTGSGKSTTLYAGLHRINTGARKIITIEDPVEYEMEGITQIQVAPEIGLTFAKGLRSVLRHDPDIMMVGEVRDLETADIAIRVALTGHLILSTLHTNDAASGVTRLLDIGVEPYLVSSSVIAFMAQRLVRVLCSHCRTEDPDVSPETKKRMIRDLGLAPNTPVKTWSGKGCDACTGTGYSGRLAIHEILLVDAEIRKMIMSHASAEAIKRRAIERGMKTLLHDGWKKVLQGLTAPQEVLQVAPPDPEVPHGASPVSKVLPQEVEEAEMESMYFESQPGEADPAAIFESPAEGKEAEEPGSRPGQGEEHFDQTQAGSFKDRRKYQRVNARIHVSYRLIDYQGNEEKVKKMKKYFESSTFDANTENISAGGVLCISPNWRIGGVPAFGASEVSVGEVLKPAALLELKINIPDGGQPVECMGKILHVMRLVETVSGDSKFTYRMGVCFLSINTVDRFRIEKFCKSKRA